MRAALLALPALLLTPNATFAQEPQDAAAQQSLVEQRAQDILAVMRGEMAYDAVFAQAFRDQVEQAQFDAISAQLQAQFGPLVGVESVIERSATAAELQIRFERGLASGNLNLEEAAPHYVNGFLLTGVEPLNDNVEALLEDIAALPGEANLLIMPLGTGEPVAAHNADVPMALGSTFKLYVLSALAQSIAAGEHSWGEVVPLSQTSFPSGILQDWPEGAPVTLHTLATLMISISDNTATDQLISVLGRDAVEAEVAASGHSDPALLSPFMMTRELFVLKSGTDGETDAYRTSDTPGRLAMLESLADIDRTQEAIMAAFTGGPNAIDLEWFASARDVAAIFDRLRGDETALGVMGINTAMADAELANWAYVGFKGGSEPGVLNFSYLLQDAQGDWSVVTLGWNNPDASVDQQQFNLLAMRAIALAR
ncbi:serine hydrolase [Erythrobacter alti]|uniref:serine hydrolase n=1 Tax=Erythrobacter alti TaxID=1896145 RepID=UPI0030F400C6